MRTARHPLSAAACGRRGSDPFPSNRLVAEFNARPWRAHPPDQFGWHTTRCQRPPRHGIQRAAANDDDGREGSAGPSLRRRKSYLRTAIGDKLGKEDSSAPAACRYARARHNRATSTPYAVCIPLQPASIVPGQDLHSIHRGSKRF
jgi:hypothetical protein